MIEMLKRRWFLLSCVAVLAACSFVDLPCHAGKIAEDWRTYGVHRGYFFWCVNDLPRNMEVIETSPVGTWYSYSMPSKPELRRPMLGGMPWYDSGPTSAFVSTATSRNFLSLGVPIWIPLSVAFGWIVIRELRWREKRAKAKDALG